jgi:hypothetical protein
MLQRNRVARSDNRERKYQYPMYSECAGGTYPYHCCGGAACYPLLCTVYSSCTMTVYINTYGAYSTNSLSHTFPVRFLYVWTAAWLHLRAAPYVQHQTIIIKIARHTTIRYSSVPCRGPLSERQTDVIEYIILHFLELFLCFYEWCRDHLESQYK